MKESKFSLIFVFVFLIQLQQIRKRGKIQTQNLHENTERLHDYQQIVPFRLLLFTNQICQISEFLSVFEI